MTNTLRIGLCAIFALSLTLAACGGGGGGNDELVQQILRDSDGEVTEAEARCFVRELGGDARRIVNALEEDDSGDLSERDLEKFFDALEECFDLGEFGDFEDFEE